MIVPMDKMSAPKSRELAQHLYEKNAELDIKRHKGARIPSDINAWQQMRENYETIILEDHIFSEQHEIEYALWQLHYKRIEEFRAQFNSAPASMSSASQNAKGPSKSDRIAKLRLQFKSFLSEASGFYHDFIFKIRAKYGIPLGHFSEELENQIVLERDARKHADMKRGLVSWHRCLIYLGDIARYKGLYGDSESKIRDFTAASSYYLQASSLCPSSGNPHHQLAILATYSGDELITVYHCFRSLAIECPFLTAKDNLIVAFEKNRQAYIQLSKNFSTPASDMNEAYKAFRVQFVRLNGVIFSRTCLETFSEVRLQVKNSLNLLISCGANEKLNFGKDDAENGLIIVRLVAILIFSAHNAKREIDGQSFAEILQRKVLLENASTAVFEFMGHIISRCKELQDVSSSCLLPGILVFMEWLASCPDIAPCTEVNDEHAEVRLTYWNYCVEFLNKILLDGVVSTDDEDETCFFNMSAYEEGENDNQLALWEDLELRGFLPLAPAHNILDFSRKHSSGSIKERKARVQRIFAAGKVLAKIVKVGQKSLCFDSTVKRFSFGVESYISGDESKFLNQEELQYAPVESVVEKGMSKLNGQFCGVVEGNEEDEEIVFKPTMSGNVNEAVVPSSDPNGIKVHDPYSVASDSISSSSNISVCQPYNHNQGQIEFQAIMQPHVPMQISGGVPQYHGLVQSLNWPVEQLANSFTDLSFFENCPRNDATGQVELGMSYSLPYHVHQVTESNTTRVVNGQIKNPDSFTTSKVGTIWSSELKGDASVSVAFLEGSRKSLVSRPHRHLGPPPGFNSAPRKQMTDSVGVHSSEEKVTGDHSLLDGHRMPMAMSSNGLNNPHNHFLFQVKSQANGIDNNMFPLTGREFSRLHDQVQQDIQQSQISFEHLGKQELQYHHQQQMAQARVQNQHPGIPNWPGHNVV